MTVYAGEVIRIKSTATGFDGTYLTPTQITTATIQIFNSAGTQILAPTAMLFDTAGGFWYYDWATGAISAGKFKAKVRMVGALYDNWEIIALQLKQSPV